MAAIAFGRSSEPSLEEERQEYRYRSLSMGFGLEGVNSNTGFATPRSGGARDVALAARRDRLRPALRRRRRRPTSRRSVVLTATPSSTVGASFKKFRWDFGDGEPCGDEQADTVHHNYKKRGDYAVRLEVTDDLGHRSVQHQTVVLSKH